MVSSNWIFKIRGLSSRILFVLLSQFIQHVTQPVSKSVSDPLRKNFGSMNDQSGSFIDEWWGGGGGSQYVSRNCCFRINYFTAGNFPFAVDKTFEMVSNMSPCSINKSRGFCSALHWLCFSSFWQRAFSPEGLSEMWNEMVKDEEITFNGEESAHPGIYVWHVTPISTPSEDWYLRLGQTAVL